MSALRAHADADAPNECCGLLLGTAGSIELVWPARNCSFAPRTRFEVDPEAHFAAIRHARATEWAVIGAYHSHPGGDAHPSSTDRALAFGGFLFVIVSRTTRAVRGWELVGGNFEEVPLVSCASLPEP